MSLDRPRGRPGRPFRQAAPKRLDPQAVFRAALFIQAIGAGTSGTSGSLGTLETGISGVGQGDHNSSATRMVHAAMILDQLGHRFWSFAAANPGCAGVPKTFTRQTAFRRWQLATPARQFGVQGYQSTIHGTQYGPVFGYKPGCTFGDQQGDVIQNTR